MTLGGILLRQFMLKEVAFTSEGICSMKQFNQDLEPTISYYPCKKLAQLVILSSGYIWPPC